MTDILIPNPSKVTMQGPKTPLEILVVNTLEDFKALNLSILDVHTLTSITDTMIIATGNSNRHLRALAENILKIVKEQGYIPLGVEGMKEAEWILIDLGDVVIHLMLSHVRDFYHLEKLWQLPLSKKNLVGSLASSSSMPL